MEEFRVIKNFENYEISNFGNVFNIKRNKNLKQSTHTKGYLNVWLRNNNDERVFVRVHRLVAEAFIPNPQKKLFIDHIDGDRKNNNVNNLRWASINENSHNRQIPINNNSGSKGVCFDKENNKYMAYITCKGIRRNLGRYKTLPEAQEKRKQIANLLFGEFTHNCEKIKENKVNINIILNNANTEQHEIEIKIINE